jgi:hypothetical protein
VKERAMGGGPKRPGGRADPDEPDDRLAAIIEKAHENRLGRSLTRLGFQLVTSRSGFSIADDRGRIMQSRTVFSSTMGLGDVEAWIKKHVSTKAREQQ